MNECHTVRCLFPDRFQPVRSLASFLDASLLKNVASKTVSTSDRKCKLEVNERKACARYCVVSAARRCHVINASAMIVLGCIHIDTSASPSPYSGLRFTASPARDLCDVLHGPMYYLQRLCDVTTNIVSEVLSIDCRQMIHSLSAQ